MKNSVERISLVLGLKKPCIPLESELVPPVHREPSLPNLSQYDKDHH